MRDNLELSYRAMRDERATPEECVARFHAVAVVEQIRTLAPLAAIDRLLPESKAEKERLAAFLEFENKPRRRGIFDVLFGTPRRGAMTGVAGLLLATGAGVVAASSIAEDEHLAIDVPIGATGDCGPAAAEQLADGDFLICEWGHPQGAKARKGPDQQNPNPYNPTPTLVARVSNVRSVAYGASMVTAVLADGTVQGWRATVPTAREEKFYRQAPLDSLQSVKQIDGPYALLEDGSVWGWASTALEPLGVANPWELDWSAPRKIDGLEDVTAISVGGGWAGATHVLALRADGKVLVWGLEGVAPVSSSTQVDESARRTVPTLVPGLNEITAISAGSGFSLALSSDGAIWTWGDDSVGQLGDGGAPQDGDRQTLPVQVDMTMLPQGVTATAISAGFTHSLAALSDGTAIAWGYSEEGGQIGAGPSTGAEYRTVPVRVDLSGLPPGEHVVDVEASGLNSSVLLGNGTVMTWGDDSWGGLGNDERLINSPIPVLVPNLVGVQSLAGVNLVVVGSCRAPGCDVRSADVAEDPLLGTFDDLPFEANLEGDRQPYPCDGEYTAADSTTVAASELYFTYPGLIHRNARPTLAELPAAQNGPSASACGEVVWSLSGTFSEQPLAGASISRFYFTGQKPRGYVGGPTIVYLDPAALTRPYPLDRLLVTEVAGRPAFMRGAPELSEEGEVIAPWRRPCTLGVVERAGSEAKPGIAWVVSGPACHEAAEIIEQLLREYGATTNPGGDSDD